MAIVCLSLLPSCKKDESVEVEMGYKYFPVNIGHWVVYQVDSINYNDFTHSIDTFRFQIKEIIESEFLDNQNRVCQRLERYRRWSDTASWELKDVWQFTLTTSTAEKSEENQRIVKLVFPVKINAEWNGNAYNTYPSEMYHYSETHYPAVYGSLSFDSCVSVHQHQFFSLIDEEHAKEVYASGVGMVYKEFVDIKKLPSGVIEKGVKYYYYVLTFGN